MLFRLGTPRLGVGYSYNPPSASIYKSLVDSSSQTLRLVARQGRAAIKRVRWSPCSDSIAGIFCLFILYRFLPWLRAAPSGFMFLEYFEPQCHPLEKNAPSDWLRRRFAQFSERSRNSQSPTVILLRDFQVHPPATLLMNDPVHRPFGTDIVPYSSLPFPLASLTFC